MDFSGNNFSGITPDSNFNLSLYYNNRGFARQPGHLLENVSGLEDLSVLDLSYNCFSGYISKKEGHWRFPGAFAGNPNLCVESSTEVCGQDTVPVEPGKTFQEEMVEGPISLSVFLLSAAITFYFSIVSLFCSARARRYILETRL
ncbi:uncharacterized protein J3R85_003079 [Psidium guajava]|nr:uncharacterized protein J3R85_003079 [Psidium guajava]